MRRADAALLPARAKRDEEPTQAIRRGGPWRGLEGVAFATLEWVGWVNHRRLPQPIGHVPPAEAEADYDAAREHLPLAA